MTWGEEGVRRVGAHGGGRFETCPYGAKQVMLVEGEGGSRTAPTWRARNATQTGILKGCPNWGGHGFPHPSSRGQALRGGNGGVSLCGSWETGAKATRFFGCAALGMTCGALRLELSVGKGDGSPHSRGQRGEGGTQDGRPQGSPLREGERG